VFKIFRATAFIVFAAFMFVPLATTTSHAQKPAITKSTDEPGRSPYFSSAYRYCANNGVCQISSFKPVPVGFRLVVTHASVVYVPATYSGHLDNLVSLQQSSDAESSAYFPSPSSIGANSVASAPITFYVDPGSTPEITVANSSSGNFIYGSITSYLVALN
jgi:hypothetical protein